MCSRFNHKTQKPLFPNLKKRKEMPEKPPLQGEVLVFDTSSKLSFGEKESVMLQGLDCIVPVVDFLVAAFRDRIRCVLVNYVHVRAISG